MAQEIAVATPVVPNALEYNEQESQPSRLQRRKFGAYLPPQQGGPLTIVNNGVQNTTTITFMVGAQYFLDTEQSFFVMNAQIQNQQDAPTGGGTNYAYLNPLSDSWLDQITISTGNGLQIEKITNAGTLAQIMKRTMSYNYSSSIAKEALNLFDPFNDANDLASLCERSSQNLRYVLEVRQSDFLSNSYNLLPLRLMSLGNSASLKIEFVFGSFAQIATAFHDSYGDAYISTGGVNQPPLQVVFSNFNYVQSLVQDDIKEQQLMELVRTNPIVLSYKTHNHFQTNIPAGATNLTINITEYQESVLSQHSRFIQQTNANQTFYDNTIFYNPNLVSTQTQIQPDYYPLQAINNLTWLAGIPSNSELYWQYVYTQEKEKCYEKGLSIGKYQKATITDVASQTQEVGSDLNDNGVLTTDTDDFILANDFQVFPSDAVGPSEYIQFSSGLNLKANPNPIAINIQTGSGSVASIMDTYTTFIRSMVIQYNNVFIIS